MHQNMLCNLQSEVWSLQNNSMWICIPDQHCCRLHKISIGVHTYARARAHTHTHARAHTHTHTHTHTQPAHIYIPDKGQKLFSLYHHSILAILLDVQINVRGFNYREYAETILFLIKYIWQNWNWKKFDFSFMWSTDHNG